MGDTEPDAEPPPRINALRPDIPIPGPGAGVGVGLLEFGWPFIEGDIVDTGAVTVAVVAGELEDTKSGSGGRLIGVEGDEGLSSLLNQGMASDLNLVSGTYRIPS